MSRLKRREPALTFWWCLAGSGPQTQLRRLVLRGRRSLNRRRLGFWILLVRRLLVWPIASLVQISAARQTLKARGETCPAGLLGWWWYAFFHGVTPEDYLRFELFRPEHRRRNRDFLYTSEVRYLSLATRSKADHAILRDKGAFNRRMIDAGLPTPPIVAIRTGDNLQIGPDFHAYRSWFGKPSRGHAGIGCIRFDHKSDQRYRILGLVGRGVSTGPEAATDDLDLDQLTRFLESDRLADDLVIQPAISNHPSLAKLAPLGLGVIRLLTACAGGRIVPIAASYCMPWAHHIVSQYGIFAPVSLASGRLEVAADFGLVGRRFERHPTTQAVIPGTIIPNWKECLQLGLQAHELFQGTALIGWDIAPAADGPILIEGNLTFNPHMLQISPAPPLLKTEMGRVLEELGSTTSW